MYVNLLINDVQTNTTQTHSDVYVNDNTSLETFILLHEEYGLQSHYLFYKIPTRSSIPVPGTNLRLSHIMSSGIYYVHKYSR